MRKIALQKWLKKSDKHKGEIYSKSRRHIWQEYIWQDLDC